MGVLYYKDYFCWNYYDIIIFFFLIINSIVNSMFNNMVCYGIDKYI